MNKRPEREEQKRQIAQVFGNRLDALMRRDCATNQRQLAKALGTSEPLMSRHLQGIGCPGLLLLVRTAEYFKVTIEELIKEEMK